MKTTLVTKLKVGSMFIHPDRPEIYCVVETVRKQLRMFAMTCYYREIATGIQHRAQSYKMGYMNDTVVTLYKK